MREIKYRAWLKNGKCMEDAVEINFYDKTISYIEDDYINTEQRWIEEAFENIVLMQFTGQNDKNGIEIYESDILRDSKKRKFIVTWNNDIGNWVNKPTDNGILRPCLNVGTVKGLEIIGNIYDNPELLESEGELMG